MLHDTLLACLLLHSNQNDTNNDLKKRSKALLTLHPCEQNLLGEIKSIINSIREITDFVKMHRLTTHCKPFTGNLQAEGQIRKGYYLNAFVCGLSKILMEYSGTVADIEKFLLEITNSSITDIYTKLNAEKLVYIFVQNLVEGVKLQKLCGTTLINYLYRQIRNGDQRMERVMGLYEYYVIIFAVIMGILCRIFEPIKNVFLTQLTNWMLFGVLDDPYLEFFIEISNGSAVCNKIPMQEPDSRVLDTRSNREMYRVNDEKLPSFLKATCANDIHFIGQNVLFLKKTNICPITQITNLSRANYAHGNFALWQGREIEFFELIRKISSGGAGSLPKIQNVVNEVKKYVSARILEIILNEQNLIGQMLSIKEFFLHGRGEVFTELLHVFGAANVTQQTYSAQFAKFFENSSILTNVRNMENFQLSVTAGQMPSPPGFMDNIKLSYTCKWPLELLFTAENIQLYNEIFNFLLLIRKVQYEFQLLWRDNIHQRNRNMPSAFYVRNQLMFFIECLQYYLHTDVLESEYYALKNIIESHPNFEELQIGHYVFLDKIRTGCFLNSSVSNLNGSSTTNYSEWNPVYRVIIDVLYCCHQFKIVVENCPSRDEFHNGVQTIRVRFAELINNLFHLLMESEIVPHAGPLSQLMLRLDYNKLFSSNTKQAL